MADTAKDYAKQARSSVEHAADRFKDRASDVADRAQDRLEDAGDTAREYSRRAAYEAKGTVRKYPLSTIAGAAVVGLLIGSLLKR